MIQEKKVEMATDIYCPKCNGTDIECESCDMPEWIGPMEIGTTENYLCKNPECKHRFTVAGSYVMAGFYFRYDPYHSDEDIVLRRIP